jgi:hypothetical protein
MESDIVPMSVSNISTDLDLNQVYWGERGVRGVCSSLLMYFYTVFLQYYHHCSAIKSIENADYIYICVFYFEMGLTSMHDALPTTRS